MAASRAGRALERLAEGATGWAGGNGGFFTAMATIVVWAALGPVFDYSDTWQLVINTGTTVVTFVMVFLIQRTQNKESLALHLKLNELVAAIDGASNRLIDVEALGEDELHVLREHYRELAALTRRERNTSVSHSIDEARNRHAEKFRARRPRKPADETT
jgi:low affinity Fe/Cu permease